MLANLDLYAMTSIIRLLKHLVLFTMSRCRIYHLNKKIHKLRLYIAKNGTRYTKTTACTIWEKDTMLTEAV